MTMPVFLALLAYLSGSIPTGFLFFKIKEKRDIRDFGSRSTGATNIFRIKGAWWALAVLILDIAKGFVPALISRAYLHPPFLALAISFLSVVGHCFPFAIGFRGGKGVATSVGVMAAFSWQALLISAVVFILVVTITRYVSAGSLLASLLFIPILYFISRDPYLTLVAVFYVVLIWTKHRANLRRLFAGQESRLGQKMGRAKNT